MLRGSNKLGTSQEQKQDHCGQRDVIKGSDDAEQAGRGQIMDGLAGLA